MKESGKYKQGKLSFGNYRKKSSSQPLTIGVEHIQTKPYKIDPK